MQGVYFAIGWIIGSIIGPVIGYAISNFIDWLKIRKYQKKDKK